MSHLSTSLLIDAIGTIYALIGILALVLPIQRWWLAGQPSTKRRQRSR